MPQNPSPKRPIKPNLKASLKARLHKARRVAVLAIGSDLRGDDAAGLLVAASLERWRTRVRDAGDNRKGGDNGKPELEIFVGYTAPENFTGEIKRFNPTHLLMVDAADIGLSPGEVRLIDPWQTDGPTFGTHKMPPNVFVEYIRETVKCDIVIVAIQHGGLEFAQPPSAKIRSAARKVTSAIRDALDQSLEQT